MLWSLGKDSNVMVWLARKAFFGHVPFPVCTSTPARSSRRCTTSARATPRSGGSTFWSATVRRSRQSTPPAAGARSRRAQDLGLKAAIAKHGFRASSPASGATSRRPAPRSGSSARATRPGSGTSATSRRSSGTSSRPTSRRRAPAHPPAAALDRARHLALHRARGDPRGAALLRPGRQALPLAGRPGHHQSHRVRGLDDRRDHRGAGDHQGAPERAGRAMDHEREDAFERLRASGYM